MGDTNEFVSIVPSNEAPNVTATTSFTEQYSSQIIVNECEPKKRVPKRVLHFSDGTLEEFSSDDEVDESLKNLSQVDNSKAVVDPRDLTWAPFIWYQIKKVGSKTLSACDFLGEHIADFFGITSPKYQYEIEEYFRMKTEEENERKRNMELSSWKVEDNEGTNNESYPIEEQPNAGEAKESGVYYTAIKAAMRKIQERSTRKGAKVGFKPERFY